jgi:hypothetical protein
MKDDEEFASKIMPRHIKAITDYIRAYDDREERTSAAAATARAIIIGSSASAGEEAEATMYFLMSFLADAVRELNEIRAKVIAERR